MPRKSCSGTRVTVLALSTSSPALSIALVDGRKVLARHHQRIGRGHAEALVPAIAALLTGRRVEAIIVDIGPGSYTGIRIGIAAARALGVAWGCPCMASRRWGWWRRRPLPLIWPWTACLR